MPGPRVRKILLAGAILGAGAGAASLFRRPAEPSPVAAAVEELPLVKEAPPAPAVMEPPGFKVTRQAETPLPWATSKPPAESAAVAAVNSATTAPWATSLVNPAPTAQPAPQPLSTTPQPTAAPSLVPQREPATETVADEAPPLAEVFSAPPTEFVQPRPLPVPEERPVEESEPPAPRVHKVVDGDTLASLAARYLGSPNRQQEIFDANRDTLTAPDLLPIGRELRIPPRSAPLRQPDEPPLVPVVRNRGMPAPGELDRASM